MSCLEELDYKSLYFQTNEQKEQLLKENIQLKKENVDVKKSIDDLQVKTPHSGDDKEPMDSDEQQQKKDVTIEKLQGDLLSISKQLGKLIPKTVESSAVGEERKSLTVTEEILNQIKSFKNCLEEKENLGKSAIEKYESSIAKLTEENSIQKTEIKDLKERNAHLTKYEDEADAELYRMADVIEGLRNENSKLKEEVLDAKSELEETKKENSDQQKEMRKFIDQNIFLTSYQEQADAHITELSDTVEEMRNEIAQLRYGIDELTARNIADVDELNAEIDTLKVHKQAEIDDLKKEKKAKHKELMKRIRGHQREIIETSGKYEKIKYEYEMLREAQESQQTECQIVKTGLKNLKDTLKKRLATRLFPCIGRSRQERRLEQVEELLEHIYIAIGATSDIEHSKE